MITKKTLQDGSWTVYSYDALNRLLEETKQTSVSTIYDYAYTYDLVGNRLTWTKNTTLGNFWSVDSLNMPAQVLTNLTNANYGNTAIPTQTVTLARNYAYDAANRLNNWNYGINIYSANFPIQTDTYTYDNNGNRLTKQTVLTGQESSPQQTKYSYDFENRLNQLQYVNIPNITGTQTDNFTYNAEGLRTQAVRNTTTDNYLYDGSNVLVRRDGSGNTTKSYTRGLDFGGGIGSIIALSITGSNPIAQYYDYNDLGSVADLTTSTGESASDYSYDAFGNLLTPQASGDTNRYLFSTKEFETRSGLSYFGGRYYDPEVGRWATPDPLGFVDGVNPYLYVNDNPVNLVDPYGLCGQNIGERVLDWANDNIFNNPELAPLFALPGVGALGMEAQEAESLAANTAENAAEIEENYQRFVTNLPAKAETPTTIPFGDSSVAFQAKVPATNIPGSYSVYEKQVNSYGITENYSKTTYAPDGTIVHVKYKYIRTQ
jgi:RHS repeat-associated protein